jgi:hypothetical protein
MSTKVHTLAGVSLGSIAALTVVLAGALMLGRSTDGPLAWFPGGPFSEEIERGPEPDWSFAAALDTVEVQIGSSPPRSVRTGIVVFEGVPYLPVTLSFLKRWQHVVARNPRVVVRIEGRLFERNATAVTDAEHLSRLIAAGQAKYGAPFHARWAAALTQYFRLDPIR